MPVQRPPDRKAILPLRGWIAWEAWFQGRDERGVSPDEVGAKQQQDPAGPQRSQLGVWVLRQLVL